MKLTFLFMLALTAQTSMAVPFIAREPCTEDSDCLHGFPATIPTLVCGKSSVCEARSPHYCVDSSDCKDALTTCVSKKCVHGARGAPCSTRADCGVGLYCAGNGRCIHGTPGVTCSKATAVQCADGLTCSAAEKCTPGLFNSRCVLDRNCASGFYCDGGRCAPGVKLVKPQFYPWTTTPPPMLPKDLFTNAAIGAGAGTLPQLTTEPTMEPFIGFENAVQGGGLPQLTPEPIAAEIVQSGNSMNNVVTTTVAPETISAPLSTGNGVNEAVTATVVPEPLSGLNNVVTATVVPEPVVEPQGQSNGMSNVVTATMAPETVPERNTAPAEIVANVRGTQNVVSQAKATVTPSATQEVVELTKPVTVEVLPTAIPIPKRRSLQRRKNSLSHIIVRA